MKQFFITIFLSAFLFLGLDAQNGTTGKVNVSGEWKGKITQNEGGYRSEYHFEIYLIQTGNKVRGRSYVYVDDVFAIMDLKGEIKGGSMLHLEESKIVDFRKIEDGEWCLKRSQLLIKYKDGKLHLNGYWQGESILGSCIPGKITLTKEKPRA